MIRLRNPHADSLSFNDLAGWHNLDWSHVGEAFQKTCEKFLEKQAPLSSLEQDFSKISRIFLEETLYQNKDPKVFFETYFELFPLPSSAPSSYLTGYYEPYLPARLEKSQEFQFPLFTLNPDAPLVSGPTGVPTYDAYTRRDIYHDVGSSDHVRPLVWLNDPVARYFLEVQGSGKLELPSGEICRITPQATSGHAYVAVSKHLHAEGALSGSNPLDKGSFETYLKNLPITGKKGLLNVLSLNPRIVYFKVLDNKNPEDGPSGTFGKDFSKSGGFPLIDLRSLAIDQSLIPLGLPVFTEIKDKLPSELEKVFPRLMFAHDTGGAILGSGRGDVFFGTGPRAEFLAGLLNHKSQMTILLPKV